MFVVNFDTFLSTVGWIRNV
ncbi:unnamed protein product [Priceomyces carsonii]|nr:unnamed protein product [Priceomyces carsonii]